MNKLFLMLTFLMISWANFAQTSSMDRLKTDIETVLNDKNATVGVAVMDLETKETVVIHNDFEYPTMSVYKFFIALAMLHQVDEGKFLLHQEISVEKSDLFPDTHSPLRDEHPDGGMIPLSALIGYTILKSDNNGCDILIRLVGDVQAVDEYVKKLGVNGISVQATENEMHQSWDNQYKNTSTPLAAVQILELFYNQKILSQNNRDFLWKLMVETSTGANKIKGLLPENVIVGHKTGTSFRNNFGLKAADNDIGILILPNGRKIALAVFVTNSTESDEINAKIIAKIAEKIMNN